MRDEQIAAAETTSRQNLFNAALCGALLKADIPLRKLRNDHSKNFLEAWTSQHVPAPTALGEGYVLPV